MRIERGFISSRTNNTHDAVIDHANAERGITGHGTVDGVLRELHAVYLVVRVSRHRPASQARATMRTAWSQGKGHPYMISLHSLSAHHYPLGINFRTRRVTAAGSMFRTGISSSASRTTAGIPSVATLDAHPSQIMTKICPRQTLAP